MKTTVDNTTTASMLIRKMNLAVKVIQALFKEFDLNTSASARSRVDSVLKYKLAELETLVATIPLETNSTLLTEWENVVVALWEHHANAGCSDEALFSTASAGQAFLDGKTKTSILPTTSGTSLSTQQLSVKLPSVFEPKVSSNGKTIEKVVGGDVNKSLEFVDDGIPMKTLQPVQATTTSSSSFPNSSSSQQPDKPLSPSEMSQKCSLATFNQAASPMPVKAATLNSNEHKFSVNTLPNSSGSDQAFCQQSNLKHQVSADDGFYQLWAKSLSQSSTTKSSQITIAGGVHDNASNRCGRSISNDNNIIFYGSSSDAAKAALPASSLAKKQMMPPSQQASPRAQVSTETSYRPQVSLPPNVEPEYDFSDWTAPL